MMTKPRNREFQSNNAITLRLLFKSTIYFEKPLTDAFSKQRVARDLFLNWEVLISQTFRCFTDVKSLERKTFHDDLEHLQMCHYTKGVKKYFAIFHL